MNRNLNKIVGSVLLAASVLLLPMPSMAEDDLSAMKARIEALEKELAAIREIVNHRIQETASKEEVQELKQEVETAQKEQQELKQEVEVTRAEQQEWKTYDSRVHLGGYAAVGFTDAKNENASFGPVNFNPIFHYMYKDLVLLESELEIDIEDGDTEVGLEYLTLDVFLNDYATILGGKFLSPVGFFRQNLHPTWVNKLPDAPPGFGHDEAAPVSELGAQVRGGFQISNPMYANYALYVSNGPILELNAAGDEIEAVEAEGTISNDDDKFTFGGRLGFLPIPMLELGVSGACCKVALPDEPDRDYYVFDLDGAWQWRNLNLRGEYVRTKVGSQIASVAPEGQSWESYYAQVSYRFLPTKFEPVVRYTNYDSTHADQDQKQWALGLNYVLAPQAIGKISYEFNDGLTDEPTDDDRFLLQFAYGF